MDFGDGGLDFTELVADGGDVETEIGAVQSPGSQGHQDDGHERTGNFFRHLRGEGYHGDAEQSHGGGNPIYRVEILKIDHPFRQEIAR